MVALSVQAHHDSMAVFQYMYCHYDSYRYRHLAVLVYPANRDYLVDLHQLFSRCHCRCCDLFSFLFVRLAL